ncbi:hypothetical protein GPECTOR_95g678 [Gonium pectorale]|uniref:tRNA pseudouridine(55) synthase n=1 Tax=Gonium pectorale TaxID=33097 RepID=A0A150G0B1_GONPE|nr:hypothetical protein GPECTOR_95g678 [Gonium pectorale]|eukprot:KXZ43289.1 hypothetical protein GPECTOR_95g678 [Gonium pectorale]
MSLLRTLGGRPRCVPGHARAASSSLRAFLGTTSPRGRRDAAAPRAAALDSVASAEPESRDRTAEASSSTPIPAAPTPASGTSKKANRPPPELIKPGPINDLSILQNGVILVDKPLGWTSFDVCGKIRNMIRFLEVKKVGGQKMYSLAREGQVVELPPRPVSIASLRLWRSEAAPQDVHFYVHCSKGTYIRSLAYDIGRCLGSAAHLVALRREASGAYRAGDAWQMRDLIDELQARREAFRAAAEAAAAEAAEVAAAEAAGAVGTEAARKQGEL